MAVARFTGILLEGHKGAAVEVPFDPRERWNRDAVALWPGRRGWPVAGEVGGVRFESAIVARSRRYWLLVGEDLCRAAKLAVGDSVRLAIDPGPSATALTPPKRTIPAKRRTKG